MTTYTAAIGLTSDVLAGDYCDVTIGTDVVYDYLVTDDGTETPLTRMSDEIVFGPAETTVRHDADDRNQAARDAADALLATHGWHRAGGWEDSDNAAYAPVQRAE